MDEASYIVSLDETGVTCRHPSGKVEAITWEGLRIVILATTDDGPFSPDVFWMLGDSEIRCTIPQGATGESALLSRFQSLPGFNNEAVIAAMGSTEPAEFVCWKRD